MEELQPIFETEGEIPPGMEKKIREKKKTGRKPKTMKKDEVLKMGEFVKVGDNWIPEEIGESVEGFVGEVFVAPTKIGQGQFCMIGDHRVLISGGLKPLLTMQGAYVKLVYQGYGESVKGKFRKFDIFRRPEE